MLIDARPSPGWRRETAAAPRADLPPARHSIQPPASPMAVVRAFQALERVLDGNLGAPASVQDGQARNAILKALYELLEEIGEHEQRVQALE